MKDYTVHVNNAKYGQHGNGKIINLDNDKEFWDWWDNLSDEEKEQEVGK